MIKPPHWTIVRGIRSFSEFQCLQLVYPREIREGVVIFILYNVDLTKNVYLFSFLGLEQGKNQWNRASKVTLMILSSRLCSYVFIFLRLSFLHFRVLCFVYYVNFIPWNQSFRSCCFTASLYFLHFQILLVCAYLKRYILVWTDWKFCLNWLFILGSWQGTLEKIWISIIGCILHIKRK